MPLRWRIVALLLIAWTNLAERTTRRRTRAGKPHRNRKSR